ncbi:Os06g0705250, partial [Oryza sativa Japonica Group]
MAITAMTTPPLTPVYNTGREDRFWSDSQINTPFLLLLYSPSGHEQLYPPGKFVQIIPSGHPSLSIKKQEVRTYASVGEVGVTGVPLRAVAHVAWGTVDADAVIAEARVGVARLSLLARLAAHHEAEHHGNRAVAALPVEPVRRRVRRLEAEAGRLHQRGVEAAVHRRAAGHPFHGEQVGVEPLGDGRLAAPDVGAGAGPDARVAEACRDAADHHPVVGSGRRALQEDDPAAADGEEPVVLVGEAVRQRRRVEPLPRGVDQLARARVQALRRDGVRRPDLAVEQVDAEHPHRLLLLHGAEAELRGVADAVEAEAVGQRAVWPDAERVLDGDAAACPRAPRRRQRRRCRREQQSKHS